MVRYRLNLATNEREGSEIARQIIRALMKAGVKVCFVTHLERNERTGAWEIAGMPDEVIRGFSKRREAIELVQESRLARGESWSPKVAQWIATSSRPEKEHVDGDVLRERWRSDPLTQGWTCPRWSSGQPNTPNRRGPICSPDCPPRTG